MRLQRVLFDGWGKVYVIKCRQDEPLPYHERVMLERAQYKKATPKRKRVTRGVA